MKIKSYAKLNLTLEIERKNSNDFRIYNLESPIDGISNLNCTVDYPKDIKKITKIMGNKKIIPADLTFNQIINNLKKYS